MWLFNFNAILKTCFKNLFRKTVKIGDFTLLNKPLEPYKLTKKAYLVMNTFILMQLFPIKKLNTLVNDININFFRSPKLSVPIIY